MITDNRQLRLNHELDAQLKTGYQIRLSDELENPEWDAFLTGTPGGHHVQTSLWAQIKATLGWRTKRLIVKQGERIVGGAQILIRPLPVAGAVGYVSKGPLFAQYDPQLMALVINELKQVVKACRIQNLTVQPPDNGQALAQQLPGWGFQPSTLELGVTATTKLDLTPDLDTILSQMKPKTRYNIRLGLRKGVTVRAGGEQDLPIFYQSLLATGQRQDFTPYPEAYFREMWRILEPYGYIKLFLAEYQNEVLSTLLAIPFGDTVIYKKGTWQGQRGNLRPNEVMHWTAIQWAKEQGYRYYDLEGIDRPAAIKLLAEEPLPSTMLQTTTRFKLGFGGQVMLFPAVYDYVYNPLLRWSYSTAYPKVQDWPVVRNTINYLHKR